MEFFETIKDLKNYSLNDNQVEGINEGLLNQFKGIISYVDEELENDEFAIVTNTIKELENSQTLSNKKEAQIIYLALLQINKDLILKANVEELSTLIPKIKSLDIENIKDILKTANAKSI